MIKAILAVGENGEIGQNGDMPWGRGLPKDLEYFKEQTFGVSVLFGRKTRDSLPFKDGLFPSRYNYILTRNPEEPSEHPLQEIIQVLKFHEVRWKGFEELWLVGGATIYKQFWDYVEEVHITRVKASFPEADTFFEPDLTGFEKVGDDTDVSGEYEAFVEVWRRNP